MLYYRIKENNIYDYSDFEYASDCKTTDIVTKEQLDAHLNLVIVRDDELVLNPNYEQEEAQKEKERIQKLKLTKREVFLALYDDKNITPETLKAQITDPRALIEFEYANDYYRFNPLIDAIGVQLGYTSDDLDYLFEHKEFPSHEESVTE